MSSRSSARLAIALFLFTGLAFATPACDKDDAKVTNLSAERERSKKSLDCTGNKWGECLKKAKEMLSEKSDEAMVMYDTVCKGAIKTTKNGDSTLRACFEAGRALAKGDWVRKDIKAAQALFAKACEGNYPEACADLGSGYQTQDFGPPDDAKAALFLKKACDGGHEFSCSAAAKMATIVEIGREADWPRLCEAGNGKSCLKLAMRYYNASPKDNVNGSKFFSKACDGGQELGCDILAQMYVKKWIPGGDDAAIASWGKGCELKSAICCSNSGMLQYRGKSYDGAFASLKKSCELEPSRIACASVGQLYLGGKGTTKDIAKARAALVLACDAGESTSCTQVKEIDEQTKGAGKKKGTAKK